MRYLKFILASFLISSTLVNADQFSFRATNLIGNFDFITIKSLIIDEQSVLPVTTPQNIAYRMTGNYTFFTYDDSSVVATPVILTSEGNIYNCDNSFSVNMLEAYGININYVSNNIIDCTLN